MRGGYLFYKNAQYHRITRFRPNGVPLDRPGHYIYIRDDDTGDYWSVSLQPVGKDLSIARYEVRHGLSYSIFLCEYQHIRARQTLFIPLDDEVELWDLTLENTGNKPRNLSVFSYCEFSFNYIDIDNQNFQMSLYCSGSRYNDGVIEIEQHYNPGAYHFFTSTFVPDGFDAVRDTFIGPYRTETNPLVVEQGACIGSTELGGNHCGVLHKRLRLESGGSIRLIYLLGDGDRNVAEFFRSRYENPDAVDTAFQNLHQYWEAKCAAFL